MKHVKRFDYQDMYPDCYESWEYHMSEPAWKHQLNIPFYAKVPDVWFKVIGFDQGVSGELIISNGQMKNKI